MTDQDVLDYFIVKRTGRINNVKLREKNLIKAQPYVDYLKKRFCHIKPTPSLLVCITLLKKGLNDFPKCEECSKQLNNLSATFCSRSCANKNKDKIRLTSENYFKKTGYSWASKDPKVKKKVKDTCTERFNAPNPLASKEIQSKIECTNLNKIGVKRPFQSPLIQKKISEGNEEKYGVRSQFKRPEIIQKSMETKLEKEKLIPGYSTGFFGSVSNIQGLQKKFGENIVNISQTEYFQRNHFNKYYYDNNYFDSAGEVYYYIYCKENSIPIIRIPYGIRYENNKSIYFPDFQINGNQLIEIKGPHLINEIGILIDIKTHQTNSHLLAKTKCMWDNNVEVIVDIKEYKKFCEEVKGKNFIRNYKIKRGRIDET